MKKSNPKKVRQIILRKPVTKGLYRGFEAEGWADRLTGVCERTAALYRENAEAPKALKTHLKQLLPMIAFYEAARQAAGSREAALAFFERYAFTELTKMIGCIRPFMKLGLYRLVPVICEPMLDKLFGRAAGFDYRRVPDAPPFAVDMLRCPYVDTCARYGCPELTRFACEADDITYGSLHPKLVWQRTQTLGKGGSCCDFRLYIDKEKRK